MQGNDTQRLQGDKTAEDTSVFDHMNLNRDEIARRKKRVQSLLNNETNIPKEPQATLTRA